MCVYIDVSIFFGASISLGFRLGERLGGKDAASTGFVFPLFLSLGGSILRPVDCLLGG
jgi:hypothetical protein